MKFQDFLTLKEDEGGVGGEAAPATTGTEGQGIETQAATPTEGEGDPERVGTFQGNVSVPSRGKVRARRPALPVHRVPRW